jgi:hypothetical protein
MEVIEITQMEAAPAERSIFLMLLTAIAHLNATKGYLLDVGYSF